MISRVLKILCFVILCSGQDEFVSEITTQSLSTDMNITSEVFCILCECSEGLVNCTNRQIKEPFEKDDWEGLVSLKPTKIDLSHNQISTLTRIGKLPIQYLNISNCELIQIDQGAFSRLQDLVSLDLSRNKLATSSMVRGVFAGPMMTTDRQALTPGPFQKIKFLSLAYNDIHSLPQDLFIFMTFLTTLDLSGNPLAFIDQVTMAAITDLINLKELRLGSCELETLPEGMLRRQRKLHRLDLSDNRFTTVPAALNEAPKLIYLNFDKNPLPSIDKPTAISNLTNLQELQMCRLSKLQSIGAGGLGGLESLTSLRLCYNPRLTTLDPDFLAWTDEDEVEDWPELKELYLNNNNLTTIDSHFLDRWDQLTRVDFSNNPYVCDCNSQWMVDVLTPLVENIAVDGSTEHMICRKPQELRALSFTQLKNTSKTLTCPESENVMELPIPDMAILLGIMIGIFATFPIVLIVVLLWRNGYFQKCRRKSNEDSDNEETDAF
ncbi:hypothetical protein K1T71_000850 [Dendrolimus kikuchii]|uniref:Uncharacterized protein n=1 Tax=Dendrolimus kikuchii TaxID=765133 RepID=A0ACC1DGI5_9NEOP|nr:hypothetical protein K1T71_000850 [Dendrolimus kikuchii]